MRTGYCHFPHDREEGWFDQLTAESLLITRQGGANLRKWVVAKGRANEAADCRAYAYAALHGLYHTRRLKLEHQAEMLDRMVANSDSKGAPRPKPGRRKRGGMR